MAALLSSPVPRHDECTDAGWTPPLRDGSLAGECSAWNLKPGWSIRRGISHSFYWQMNQRPTVSRVGCSGALVQQRTPGRWEHAGWQRPFVAARTLAQGLDGVRGAVREPSPSALHCAWTWLRRQNAGPGGISAGSSERACEDDWILTHLLHTADSSPRAQVNRRARVGAQAATLAALHGDRGSCSVRRRPGGRAAVGRGRRGHAAQARCRSVPRMWPAARAA
jgi:hypothetical protein